MTIEPSAITIPQDRSMPPVRTTSVWPMAMTPTTITCCRISEKFWPVRKRSLCDAKKTLASSSASSGPKAGSIAAGSRNRRPVPSIGAAEPLLVAPAPIEAERGVPAVHPFHRLVGNESHAGINRAGHFLAGLRVLDRGLDAERRHLERILLRRGAEHSGLDVSHPGAAAVDRHDEHVLLPPGSSDCA